MHRQSGVGLPIGAIGDIEVEPSPRFVAEVAAQAEKQRSYTSRHQHSPEKFNLDPQRIRRDLSYIYDTFGLP